MDANPSALDFGLLLLRVVLGLTMAAHGYNKFFGGGRIPGTAGWFDSIGMKPGVFHARMAATTEIAAGLGLALGLRQLTQQGLGVLGGSLADTRMPGPIRRRGGIDDR